VLTGRHVYTRVRESGAFGGRKAGTGLPMKCPKLLKLASASVLLARSLSVLMNQGLLQVQVQALELHEKS